VKPAKKPPNAKKNALKIRRGEKNAEGGGTSHYGKSNWVSMGQKEKEKKGGGKRSVAGRERKKKKRGACLKKF